MKPVESPVEKTVADEKPLKKEEPKNSAEARGESFGTVMVGFQAISTWLPTKKTISYTQIFNAIYSLEAEYAWQTIDSPYIGVNLGEVTEKRFTLQLRRYVGNSFHYTIGGALSDFAANVDDTVLDTFGNPVHGSFRVQNVGITSGLGNRWQWNNGLTLGVDWIRVNIPVFATKIDDSVVDEIASGNEAKDMKDVIRTFNRIPTFVVLGLNIGYTF